MYLLAGARASGRFFHTFPLSHQFSSGPGYLARRAELLRDWQSWPPGIIAIDPATVRDDPDGSLGLNPSSFPELQTLLNSTYQPVDVPYGWKAYKRRSNP
jgi:hypothetical protein